MVHEEMEYFVPQMQTKIMNEGWASIWHARIMRALDLTDNDHIVTRFTKTSSGAGMSRPLTSARSLAVRARKDATRSSKCAN